MKIYITTHGKYEANHISLCTTSFDRAVRYFLDYSKTSWYNSMGNIEIWENDELLLDYGSMNYDIINNKKDLTYDEIREDILKQLE